MGEAPAISVRGLSKKYRLYASPRQRLLEALHPFRRKYHREFWALRDVDLEVPAGITVGLIGRNGSGKSTLLQILCSILRPTWGQVHVRGRVSALLELGAGFNPEFTGRENVVFQGRLTGLSRRQIAARMPAVAAFADIGQFLDQPVRTYSAGMFVRLAFAAAVHVDPDIVVVDEALAVGDVKFQQKCYARFGELRQAGKTILFVTHDMNAFLKHAETGVLLDAGRILATGRPDALANRYMDLLEGRRPAPGEGADRAAAPTAAPEAASERAGGDGRSLLEAFCAEVPAADRCPSRRSYNPGEYRQGPAGAEIVDYLVVADAREDPAAVRCGQAVDLYLKAQFHEAVAHPAFGVAVKTVDGLLLCGWRSERSAAGLGPVESGQTLVLKASFRMNLLLADVFVDAGVGQWTPSGELGTLDRRCAVMHLKVVGAPDLHGMANLGTTGSVIARLPPP
jgi:lipopolysaccharide transport system ATP-binding protein